MTARHAVPRTERPRDVVAGDPVVRVRSALLLVLILLAAVVALGIALTWPHYPNSAQPGTQTVKAQVTSSRSTGCSAAESCQSTVVVRLTNGPESGRSTTLTFSPGPTDPRLRVHDHVRLLRADTDGSVVYQFSDIARGRPLLLLALVFVAIVIAVGRLRGLAALAGLVFAGIVLVIYVLPALLEGQSPTRVAVLGGAAIVLVALPVSHGFTVTTAIALLGTLIGTTGACLAAAASVAGLRITGLSGEEAPTLAVLGSRASVGGLLIAGIVIGALGVLNDVTVTQVSAVTELTESGLSGRPLVAAAMRIGRHHIASTVYSLVLAYAGSALPVLLLFMLSGQSTVNVLTSDEVAPSIAAGLIGASALVLVVPVTTALAALLIRPTRGPLPARS